LARSIAFHRAAIGNDDTAFLLDADGHSVPAVCFK
jgi:hypothetical protein